MLYTRLNALAFTLSMMAIASLLPSVSLAQTAPTEAMHSIILTTLLTDPRTANIPPEKLQQLVNALAEEARVRALSTNDIRAMAHASVPGSATLFSPEPVPTPQQRCGIFPSLCPLNDAFGFDGSDVSLVVWFIFASAIAFVFLLKMRHHHCPPDASCAPQSSSAPQA